MGRPRLPWGAFVVPLLLALAGAGVSAPGATGATLTLSGAGEHPAVAVDDSGTGHIVWSEAAAGDDRMIYCRLPRGASGCEETRSFTLPAENFNGPHALVGGGQVVLVAMHCCTLSSARGEIWAVRSTDGGLSFGSPTRIGDTDIFHGGVAFGPGTGQISAVGAPTEGVLYQAEPLAGPSVPYTQRALLLGGLAPAIVSSVAMLDPLTPVVGYSDFDGQSFARVYDGSGSYNDAANWLAPTPPLVGDDSQVAGGLRGLYMIRRTGQPAKKRYVVDRYDPIAGAFGKTTNVSPKGDPIFRDFIEDAGGNLHAIWVQNDDPKEPLYLRQSSDGQSWQDRRRLARTNDDSFNLRVGAASDGGGWAVWNTQSAGGVVKAAPFGPIGGGGGGACVPSVTLGKVVALATEGCFERKGNRYTTSGAVRINGIDLTPGAGARATTSRPTARAGAKITIDKGKGTLTSTGKVLVKAGNVGLDTQKLSWNLPKQGGQLKDLAGNPAVFDAGKAGVEFLGLPVSGYVTPKLTGGAGSDLPVNLELPDPFSALLGNTITARTTLRLDNQNGLVLLGAELRAASIFLGIAEVQDLLLEYAGSDPFRLQGAAKILLPVVKSKLETNFGLEDGAFDYGNATLSFVDPDDPFSSGLPVAGQFAFLRTIGFNVATDPTRIEGLAAATGGPSLNLGGEPYAAVKVSGLVSYRFTDPGVFNAHGSGDLFTIPDVANADVSFVTSGLLSLGADFTVPNLAFSPVQLSGSVGGELSLKSGAFNLTGSGSARGVDPIPGSVGVDVIVSSKAAAGCVEAFPLVIDPTSVPPEIENISGGVAYVWSSGFKLFAGCDLGPYEATVTAAEARRARRRGAPLGFSVGKRLPQVNLAITGQGAPPRVTITGPDGEAVTSGENPSASATDEAGILTQSDEDDTAYAALPSPAKGGWTIDPLPGSSPITQVLKATGLEQPKVNARVQRARGGKRVLSYRLREIPGQKVSFFEVGEGTGGLIGRATGKRGRIEFSPADGPGGKRTIEAQVTSYGVPREVLEVTRYRAPSSKPGKPRQLNVRRQGNKAVVSWRKAGNASRYVVEAKMKDGRLLAITTRRTTVTIRDVPGIDSAKIRVAGLEADNSHGKVAKKWLKAKPKRKKQRR